MNFNKFWNRKIKGLPTGLILFLTAVFNFILDFISTFFWKNNFRSTGRKIFIQSGVSIRWPGSFVLGDNVSIGRGCKFSSDFEDSKVIIGNFSQINRDCKIDFSGDLIIGDHVVISENANIMTHTHGYNPFSEPKKASLIIEDNVWIGSNVILLPQVEKIGQGSIIASGSVLTKSVQSYSVFGGNPAKLIKRLA